jgi:D-galactarolactone cycloisomerase
MSSVVIERAGSARRGSRGRITDVTAFPLSYEYPEPVGRLALGSAYKKDVVLVRVATEDGSVGYGESHHALSPTTVAEYINTTLAPLVVGKDVFGHEVIWDSIYRRTVQTHGLNGGSVTAMSGIDIALWDLRGKLLDLPVYAMLGGQRQRIPCYSGSLSLGFDDPDVLATEVRRLVELGGFGAVKLRVGDSVAADLERVRHIRHEFGDGLDIMVDANTRYDLVDVFSLLAGLEECRVTWLEEPIPPDDVVGYAELRRSTRIPIATGENLHGRQQFLPLLQARGADILQPDPSKCGGITELKKIADLAVLHHVRLAPHASHSALNHAATLHVLSATTSRYYFESGVTDNPFANDVIKGAVGPTDGWAIAPDEPGLGVRVDESRLSEFKAIPGPCYRW